MLLKLNNEVIKIVDIRLNPYLSFINGITIVGVFNPI